MIAGGPPGPSDSAPPGAIAAWRRLHREILACSRCVVAGHIPVATPVFQGRPGQRLMLIGQAPGVTEMTARKPFAARAGRELERWMLRAGFESDDHFRSVTYITSVTKCFPGKARSGAGDRRPSRAEVDLCRPWLQAQLEMVRPRLVQLVGRLFDAGGEQIRARRAWPDQRPQPWLLPLPHPSGASRWLNDPTHRQLLEHALARLRKTWPGLNSS